MKKRRREPMGAHERAFVEAFLAPSYRDRCLAKGRIPKGDFWHRLAGELRRDRLVELPGNLGFALRFVPILRALSPLDRGTCFSDDPRWDGVELPLEDCMEQEGTVVSFVAGELALFQSEAALPRTFFGLCVRDPRLLERARREVAEASARFRASDRSP